MVITKVIPVTASRVAAAEAVAVVVAEGRHHRRPKIGADMTAL
jgi:hypothetical protein